MRCRLALPGGGRDGDRARNDHFESEGSHRIFRQTQQLRYPREHPRSKAGRDRTTNRSGPTLHQERDHPHGPAGPRGKHPNGSPDRRGGLHEKPEQLAQAIGECGTRSRQVGQGCRGSCICPSRQATGSPKSSENSAHIQIQPVTAHIPLRPALRNSRITKSFSSSDSLPDEFQEDYGLCVWILRHRPSTNFSPEELGRGRLQERNAPPGASISQRDSVTRASFARP